MFTPIKSLITYLQKNATNSTIFGGSSDNNITAAATDKANEMEVNTRAAVAAAAAPVTKPGTKNLPAQNGDMSKESPKKVSPKESPKKMEPKKVIAKKNTCPAKAAAAVASPTKAATTVASSSTTEPAEAATKTNQPATPSITVEDEDDIEAQIESSIMVKYGTNPTINKPIHKNSKILNIKKPSPKKPSSSSTDLNQTASPSSTVANKSVLGSPIAVDDEAEDIRNMSIGSTPNRTHQHNSQSEEADFSLWDNEVLSDDEFHDMPPIAVEDEDEEDDEVILVGYKKSKQAETTVHPVIDLENFSGKFLGQNCLNDFFFI